MEFSLFGSLYTQSEDALLRCKRLSSTMQKDIY